MASTREDTLTAIYSRGDRLRATRRRRRMGLLGFGAVACIVAGIVLWPRGNHHPQSVATTPATTVPAASANALATGQWTVMPDPPVGWDPYGTQGAWDGSELIVWGPVADRTLAAAAFDPVSHAWRKVPEPPLAPRVNASVVWTGTEIVVWGGIGYQSRELFNDGAAYDPAHNSWRALAASPLSARSGATIVWTGDEVIVLGGMTLDGTLVDGARYDPTADRWHGVRGLPGGAHDVDTFSAAWTGDRVVVADSYSTGTKVDASTTRFDDGIAYYSYDPTTDNWSLLASTGSPRGVEELIWTGSTVLSPPAQIWCGHHSCPGASTAGAQLDLSSNAWRPISTGPIDDGVGFNVWTGAALLRVAESLVGGGPHAMNPGDTAAWDASSDTWTRLVRAPITIVSTAVAAWTGHDAVLWGTAYDDSARASRSAGLLFTPYTKPPIVPTTPEEVAAQLDGVHGVDPILVPTAVPADWHADVSTRDGGYKVTYSGPQDERVRLAVSIPNPPPPTDTGTQEYGFRGDPQGLYQQQDATDPVTDRWLTWNEPGHWTGSSKAGVPYYLYATGVTDSVFRQIANSLTNVSDVPH